MSASAARTWLRARSPTAPAPLAGRMEDAVLATAGPTEGVAFHLAEAALVCLGSALDAGGSRSAGFDLLAADALLTCACEAAAEEGTATIEALTRAYGPARIAQLLPREP